MTRSPYAPVAGFAAVAMIATVLFGCVHAREVEPPAAAASAALEAGAAQGGEADAIFRDGAIEFIQTALREHGYDVPSTGKLDDATTAALIAFQTEKNLARTGLPDHETLRQLGLEPQALYVARDQSK